MREYRAEGDRELQPVVVYAGFAFGIGMMVLAVLNAMRMLRQE